MPVQSGPDLHDRFLRLGTGIALVGVAILSRLSEVGLLVGGLGCVIMFTAIYDRCPIYRMVSLHLKGLFQRESTQS